MIQSLALDFSTALGAARTNITSTLSIKQVREVLVYEHLFIMGSSYKKKNHPQDLHCAWMDVNGRRAIPMFRSFHSGREEGNGGRSCSSPPKKPISLCSKDIHTLLGEFGRIFSPVQLTTPRELFYSSLSPSLLALKQGRSLPLSFPPRSSSYLLFALSKKCQFHQHGIVVKVRQLIPFK